MALVAFALLSSSLGAQAPASPDLSYTFHFQRPPEPRLSIEVRFEGGAEGFTVLGWCLSQWPDLPGCGQAVTGVTVRSGLSGKVLPLEHPEPNIWALDHAPKEPLVVRYELAAPANAHGGLAHAPTVSSQYVRFLGDTALLVPEHLVGRPSVEIHYAWEGLLPTGWTAASSFAVADLAKTVHLPVSSFLQSLFFAGPVHPYEAPAPGAPPLRVAWLISEPTRAVREGFLSRLAAIRAAVSRHLGQDAGEATNFFVLPSAPGRVSAMTLTSSILFLADAEALAGVAEGSVTAAITAAHELVHTTPAGKMKLLDAPVPATFLTEALAEFIARRALYRAGLIGPKDWGDVVSGKLSKYASASSAAESRSGVAQAEPYVLGDLLVILIDSEIRRASEGKADILTLVNDLLRRSRGNGTGQVSWTGFRGSLAELTSAPFASSMEDILGQRQGLRLSGDMFTGCLRVVETPVWSFDAGFEVERSIEVKRVFGVRQGGPAWNAGLRDGDSLLEWSLQWDRSDIPVRFVVMSQGKRRSVSYLPLGSESLGFRQEVVPAAGGTRCGNVL